ncbi:MAG: glycosyltransferase family 2 protein [Microthrixaceae bacterium]
MGPRFSVLLPVRDRATDVGRATVSVLAQTYSDFEVVVADLGSVDRTVDAVRTVADNRVRIVDAADPYHGFDDALEACRGDWVSVIDAGTAVRPQWLARSARLADRTGAGVVFCGGSLHHYDGSSSEVLPAPRCSRPGAFLTRSDELASIDLRQPQDLASWVETAPMHETGSPNGSRCARTPEALVDWYPEPRSAAPEGDHDRLQWAHDAVDTLGASPIPDVDLLARYATIGGVAAARLRQHREAQALLGLARRLKRGELKPFARWAVASVPKLSDRVWDPTRDD